MKRNKLIALAVTAVFTVNTLTVVAADVGEISVTGKTNWNQHTYTETVNYSCVGTYEEYEFAQEVIKKNQNYTLVNTNYNVVSEEVPDIEPETKTVTLSGLTKTEVEEISDKMEVNGLEYELTSTQTETVEQTETVTSYISSGLTDSVPTDFPEEDTIEYESPITGEITAQTLPYTSMVLSTPYEWYDDFYLNMTFEVYNAEYYVIGDYRLTLNKDNPVLPEEAKDEILKVMELPENNYIIDGMKWTSDVYEKEGTLYRDAQAYGQQYLAEYTFNYQNDSAVTGDLYDVTLTYTEREEDVKADVTANTVYQVEATAEYKADSALTSIDKLIIAAILILLVLMIIVFFFLFRKKKDKRPKPSKEQDDSNVEQSIVIQKAKPETFTVKDKE